MAQIKDGRPTGRLNRDCTLAEVECYAEQQDGTGLEKCGTRWIPVTDEMRRSMQGSMVSMVDITPEMAARVYKEPCPPVDLRVIVKDIQVGEAWGEKAPTRTLHIAVTDEQQIQDIKASFAPSTSVTLDPLTVEALAGAGVPGDVTPEEEETWNATFPQAAKYLGTFAEPTVPFPADAGDILHPNDLRQKLVDAGVSPELLNTENTEFAEVIAGLKLTPINPCGIHTSNDLAVVADGYSTSEMDNLRAPTCPTSEEERRQQDRRQPKEENSGFNVNYYSVAIDSPKRPERAPYIFEVEDLIEALNMTFHEGTVLKSLVRSCVERELGMQKVGADYIRDSEKMIHSSTETLRIRKIRAKRGLK